MNTTLLVDGSNNFIRNYVTHPSMNANGAHCGGLFGFLNSLAAFVHVAQATRTIVVFDAEGGSQRRRALYPEYKSGRRPLKLNRLVQLSEEEEKRSKVFQFTRLHDYLADLPVSVVEVPNVEADDVIAYLAMYYCHERVVIASNDKDFHQCLNHTTSIYKPTSKCFYNVEDCVKEYGVHPVNFALARAITGDKSDNIKGVPRVGLKTLTRLCPQFGDGQPINLNKFLAECEQNTTSRIHFFAEHKELITNNYRIMRLSDAFISAFSVDSIKAQINEHPSLRATSLRTKWIRDGMSLGARFFHTMASLTRPTRSAHA